MAKIIWKVKTAKDVRNFLWELPQNLLGLILIQITNAWYSVGWDDCYFTEKIDFAVSLGSYIVASRSLYNTFVVMKHEQGYQKLSRKYGWFYLPIVGIPSVIRYLIDRYAHKNWSYKDRERWYYSGFPEKQADKYANIKRFKE